MKGMLTRSDQIQAGMTLWHVYGHIPSAGAECFTVTAAPARIGHDSLPDALVFYTNEHGMNRRFCNDCGLDGANYNHNRLFFDEASALDYLADCIKNKRR